MGHRKGKKMRPIDADALKDRLQALAYDDWNQGVSTSWADAYREVAEMVEEQPTIDAVPVRHGRNISKTGFLCSVCSFGDFDGFHGYNPKFCPNCGVPMVEGAGDELV